jgi:hypothetical protein
MTGITISLEAIIAFLALIAATYFAYRQISIMDEQRRIFERQTGISERQAHYQGQQTTISHQQAELLSQQLRLIRAQEDDRKKKDELFLLVAPLYTNFKKDYDIIDWMSLREIYKTWMYEDIPGKQEILKSLEIEILEIMRSRKGLAHEPLHSKIDAYQKKMPNWEIERGEMKPLLNELVEAVKNRYEELII